MVIGIVHSLTRIDRIRGAGINPIVVVHAAILPMNLRWFPAVVVTSRQRFRPQVAAIPDFVRLTRDIILPLEGRRTWFAESPKISQLCEQVTVAPWRRA